MKVEVIKRNSSSERELDAAEELKRQLLEQFPETPSDARVSYLIVGHDCSGKDVRDVDILAFIDARTRISFLNENKEEEQCHIGSVAIAIEVTDKDEFVPRGNHVIVEYKNGEKDKTEQNRMQAINLSSQLKTLKKLRGVDIPDIWFDSVLWMRNYQQDLDPIFRWTTMNATDGINKLFEIVARTGRRDRDGDLVKTCWKRGNKNLTELKEELISLYDLADKKQLSYGVLTRKNIDNICRENLENNEKYREQGVHDFLCLEGKPGTGKTVTLLLIAYSLLSEDIEVLFLTFNLALAYDVKQMWWHLKTRKHVRGDLSVRSQYSFFGYLWEAARKNLGKTHEGKEGDFYENYEEIYLPEMLDMFKNMSRSSLLKFMRNNSLLMQKILIDEGQDWHQSELEILEILYGKEKMISAQSETQLVRASRNINWHEWLGGSRQDNSYWRMRKSMRMKSNLVVFCNQLAERMDARFKLTSDRAKGGKVKLIHGAISEHAELIKESLSRHEACDCTPYEYLIMTPNQGSLIQGLNSLDCFNIGENVIDFSSHDLRSEFLNTFDVFSQDKMRYVNYQSSRGLEGWTCLCLSLDKFWDELDDWYEQREEMQGPSLSGQFQIDTQSSEDKKRLFKFNWLMIPLSRAVDQLIIHVDDIDSEIGVVINECMNIAVSPG